MPLAGATARPGARLNERARSSPAGRYAPVVIPAGRSQAGSVWPHAAPAASEVETRSKRGRPRRPGIERVAARLTNDNTEESSRDRQISTLTIGNGNYVKNSGVEQPDWQWWVRARGCASGYAVRRSGVREVWSRCDSLIDCRSRTPTVESITASVREAWRCSRARPPSRDQCRAAVPGLATGRFDRDVTEIHEEIGRGIDGAPRPVPCMVRLSQSAVIG
jgi:hypothetical protein